MENQNKTDKFPRVRKHIENYAIFENKLGQGSFSKVYKGLDKNTQTLVAIKQIDTRKYNLSQEPQMRELLQKEIDILQKSRHQNLISLLDMKQSSNNLYLVLEYCEGGTLKEFMIKKGGRLSEYQTVQFFQQLCSGYAVLNKQNIIHRDLKPENILLHKGNVKIGDFGFARYMEGDSNDPKFMSIKCSPLYASPQLLEKQQYSSKSDVFSMGVIFYEMLYGQTPFSSESLISLLSDMQNKLLKNQLEFPIEIKVSDIVKDIIIQMLQYHEKDRISWQEVFEHPVLSYVPNKLIDCDFDEEAGNPLTRSIEKAARTSFKKKPQVLVNNDTNMEEEGEGNKSFGGLSEINSQAGTNDDEKYGYYLQQIQKKQKSDNTLKTIDDFLLFTKKRAQFAHRTLINFWNGFQNSEEIKRYVKCQTLICLSGYQFYSMVALKKLLFQEAPQSMFKQEQFQMYLQSDFCKNTKEIIEEDLKEAEILHQELQNLCNSEFQDAIQNTSTCSDQEKQIITQFIQITQDPSITFQFFIQYFPRLIPWIFYSWQWSFLTDVKLLQSLYMILIFAFIETYMPVNQYKSFDFDLFEENHLVNQGEQELKNSIQQALNNYQQQQQQQQLQLQLQQQQMQQSQQQQQQNQN